MRHTFLSLLLLVVLSPSVGFARNEALENVQRAQALLGPEIWSQIVLIHPEPASRSAGREVYALIFEFSGLLWFYDARGTQSFSRHVGNLEREREDFGPLLRGVDPGFLHFVVVDAAPEPGAAAPDSILNGCFVESIAALQHRLRSGERIERARLLSYYQDVYGTIVGHTVLAFETPDGAYVIDPQLGSRPTRIARTLHEDPKRVARSLLLSHLLVQARWIEAPVANGAKIARVERARPTRLDS